MTAQVAPVIIQQHADIINNYTTVNNITTYNYCPVTVNNYIMEPLQKYEKLKTSKNIKPDQLYLEYVNSRESYEARKEQLRYNPLTVPKEDFIKLDKQLDQIMAILTKTDDFVTEQGNTHEFHVRAEQFNTLLEFYNLDHVSEKYLNPFLDKLRTMNTTVGEIERKANEAKQRVKEDMKVAKNRRIERFNRQTVYKEEVTELDLSGHLSISYTSELIRSFPNLKKIDVRHNWLVPDSFINYAKLINIEVITTYD